MPDASAGLDANVFSPIHLMTEITLVQWGMCIVSSQNRFSCGPFGCASKEEIFQVLAALGLRMSEDGAGARCEMDASGGLRLEVSGSGVRGYMLAEDGEEAELQDVKRLLLTCSAPGQMVAFSGTAALSETMRITVAGQATHDGRRVKWTSTRTVHGPGRQVRVVVDNVD